MKFLFKLIILIIIAGALYAGAASYYPVHRGMIAVVSERTSGHAVHIFDSETKFVPYRPLFWLYTVAVRPKEKTVTCDLSFSIPSLKGLKGDFYSIQIPLAAVYSVDPSGLTDLSLLDSFPSALEKRVTADLKTTFGRSIQDYLSPVYRGENIILKKSEILDIVKSEVSADLKDGGLSLLKLEYAGPISFPDQKVYAEGLRNLDELRRITIANEEEILRTKNKLSLDSQKMHDLYERYRTMSGIIKENPDILKYIYIDKIGADLKVIISSDRSMFPLFLNDKKMDAQKSTSGEIDNLR